MLKIPSEALDCVVFLAVEDERSRLHYGGTGTIVSLPSEGDRYYPYLVTARHNIERGRAQAGRLVARYNTRNGGEIIDLSQVEVIAPEDAAIDLAVIGDLDWAPIIEGGGMGHLSLSEMAATDEFMRENDIGVGSEAFATGLLAGKSGRERNLAIGRTGTISAMPLESFEDEGLGRPYFAYLVEMRSLGGLSGSPVYVMTQPRFIKTEEGDGALDQALRFLGVIRGHWNYRPEATAVDFDQAEAELVHSGITIVTPVDRLMELLDREDLQEDRRRRAP